MSSEIRALGEGSVTYSVTGGKPRIDARAVVYDAWSVDLGGFKERIRPGAFTLETDLVALWDHDSSKVLGRVSAGTMDVRSDTTGIDFTAYPPNTTWAQDLRESMSRGDIRGCSFRMYVDEDKWYVQDGQVYRDVLKARVNELTITSMPAYPETTAEARSTAASLQDEKRDTIINISINAAETEQPEGEEPEGEEMGCECEDPCTDPNCTCTDPECSKCNQDSEGMGGAPEASRSSAGAAESKTARTFVPGFGFIHTKGK